MRRTQILELAFATPLFALVVNAVSVPIHTLFERASSCAISGEVECSGSGLPSNFCCAASSTCVILASNTTLVCCPEGDTCTRLVPVTCDVSLLNATSNPSSELLTTNLDGTLPTCGSACCPYGYSCYNNEICIMNANQNPSSTASSTVTVLATSVVATATSISIPSATTSVTTASSTQSSTTASKSTDPAIPITASSTQSSASAVSKSNSSTFSTKSILIGLFPGLVAGVLITVAIFCFLGARRRKAQKIKVSSPISHPGSALRSDFLRRDPHTPRSTINTTPKITPMPVRTRPSTIQRVRSLFHRSNASSDTLSTFASNAPVSPVQRMTMQPSGLHPSPLQIRGENHNGPRLQQEPSLEEINVGFQGMGLGLQGVDGLDRNRPQTSFSEMMKRADEPFVPGRRMS